MGLEWLKEMLSRGPVESPHIPTKREYWKERMNDPVRTWCIPIPHQLYKPTASVVQGTRVWHQDSPPCLPEEEQQKIIDIIKHSWKVIHGGLYDPLVEVEGEGEKGNYSIRFKVRKAYNLELQSGDLVAHYNICKQVRKELNVIKKFRTCKVFMLVYEDEPEMTSLNIVYNPHWRRYENFEIMYRSQVQLRRARR